MIYEFIERLEDIFKAIIHQFRRIFCTYYKRGRCGMQRKCFGHELYCQYWHCPKRKEVMKGLRNEDC